jgi:nitrate reductase / nitrite oxidoreductase, alpha subunit
VPQTRTPDAHFYDRGPLPGTKTVTVICPDYSEAAKFGDIWLNPSRAPTLRWPWPWATSSCASSTSTGRSEYFEDYVRRYTDMPMLVLLEERADGSWSRAILLRAST